MPFPTLIFWRLSSSAVIQILSRQVSQGDLFNIFPLGFDAVEPTLISPQPALLLVTDRQGSHHSSRHTYSIGTPISPSADIASLAVWIGDDNDTPTPLLSIYPLPWGFAHSFTQRGWSFA